MEAWEQADYAPIRAILAQSATRLALAGADFFLCPDNTAHIALEEPGDDLALPGLHIAEIVTDRAAKSGYRRIGVLGTKYLMDAPLYPCALSARGRAAEPKFTSLPLWWRCLNYTRAGSPSFRVNVVRIH